MPHLEKSKGVENTVRADGQAPTDAAVTVQCTAVWTKGLRNKDGCHSIRQKWKDFEPSKKHRDIRMDYCANRRGTCDRICRCKKNWICQCEVKLHSKRCLIRGTLWMAQAECVMAGEALSS